MDKCIRCGVKEDKVKLFDAVCNGKVGIICERCSIIENVPIIIKPNASQIKESKKGVEVYERMKRLAGIPNPKKIKPFFLKNRLEELEKNPRLEVPEKNKIELIEHFHWEIMTCRRRRGLSQKQLAEAIGEPEFNITMIEKGNLVPNLDNLIEKLESFLSIRLRKINPFEKTKKENLPILLDENGNVLDRIPEPELNSDENFLSEDEYEIVDSKENGGKKFFSSLLSKFKKKDITSELEENEEVLEEDLKEDSECEDFDLDKVDITQVKIGDLKELHRKKIEVTKEEKAYEQKKIEERQRLIEARKEELKLIKEKESRNLDSVLGGAELLRKRESG
jgi:ribosome-binding protein aMBF1 (putative translation factor)